MAGPTLEIRDIHNKLTVEQANNILQQTSSAARLSVGTSITPILSGVVDVTAFGADPTGANLCNDAFTAAALAGQALYLPPFIQNTTTQAIYRLADWAPPAAGRTLFSFTGFSWPAPYYGPMIKKHSSATSCVFDLSNLSTAASTCLTGFAIDGVNRSAHGVKQGADNLLFRDLVVAVCNDGFGGAFGKTSRFENTHAYQCVVGYRNQVDSKFYGCAATACRTYGVRWESGASFNSFHGRIEWNGSGDGSAQGGNLSLFESQYNVVDATNDAGYLYGVRSIRSIGNSIRGQMRRNGRYDGTDSCQIYLSGTQGFQFDGVFSKDDDDSGQPPITPKYGVIIDGGSSTANSDISLSGVLTSGTVKSIEKRGLATNRLYIKGTDDGMDEDSSAPQTTEVFVQPTQPVASNPFLWVDTSGGNVKLWAGDGT